MAPPKADFSWNNGSSNSFGLQVLDKLSLILLVISVGFALPLAGGIAGDIVRGLLSLIRIDIRLPPLDMFLVLRCAFIAPCVASASGVLRGAYSRLTTGSFSDDPLMRTIGAVLLLEMAAVAMLAFMNLLMNRVLPD